MNPLETIPYGKLTNDELADLASRAWAERERRLYDRPVVEAAAQAINDADLDGSLGSDKSYVIAALNAIRKAGWRIVRTDPNTEPGERPIVVEEWTP